VVGVVSTVNEVLEDSVRTVVEVNGTFVRVVPPAVAVVADPVDFAAAIVAVDSTCIAVVSVRLALAVVDVAVDNVDSVSGVVEVVGSCVGVVPVVLVFAVVNAVVVDNVDTVSGDV
jgi:hypothetical protein